MKRQLHNPLKSESTYLAKHDDEHVRGGLPVKC